MFYTIRDIFSTTRKAELIEKKKFAIIVFDLEYKAFIIYIIIFNISSNLGDKIYLLKKTQIVYLKADKALTEVFSKYANFTDIFSLKLAAKLPKHI